MTQSSAARPLLTRHFFFSSALLLSVVTVACRLGRLTWLVWPIQVGFQVPVLGWLLLVMRGWRSQPDLFWNTTTDEFECYHQSQFNLFPLTRTKDTWLWIQLPCCRYDRKLIKNYHLGRLFYSSLPIRCFLMQGCGSSALTEITALSLPSHQYQYLDQKSSLWLPLFCFHC
jgi:hypothetical protein